MELSADGLWTAKGGTAVRCSFMGNRFCPVFNRKFIWFVKQSAWDAVIFLLRKGELASGFNLSYPSRLNRIGKGMEIAKYC